MLVLFLLFTQNHIFLLSERVSPIVILYDLISSIWKTNYF